MKIKVKTVPIGNTGKKSYSPVDKDTGRLAKVGITVFLSDKDVKKKIRKEHEDNGHSVDPF